MTTTTRQVIIGRTVVLEIDVRDARGNRIDADSQPQVSIIDSQGTVRRSMSSNDVVRIQEGRYRYSYTVSAIAPTGIWIDHWEAVVNGFPTEARLNFVVLTASADIEVAGAQIGDDPNIQWSEAEIIGLNVLIECLQNRLKNKVQVESTDAYGNIEYVDCRIFTIDELTWFLKCSLSEFNQTPHFTDFTFADSFIYNRYGHIIVEGAFILATAAQMLIEAGREFTITDNGITMNPPPLSTVLNNELSHFINRHTEMLKYIKNSIKPSPVGFGGFRVLAVSPNYMRLRHLRQRRIV
jgi:hypothetical protein